MDAQVTAFGNVNATVSAGQDVFVTVDEEKVSGAKYSHFHLE
jgi:hypothetical protein